MVLSDPSNITSTESTPQQQDTQHVQEPQSIAEQASQFVLRFFSNILSDQCRAAYSFYHFYFHIGCAFFLLAFLVTSYRYGNALYMRCMFTFGCILFLMYSYLVECHPDVLIWTLAFIAINLIHMILLISKLKPVKFEKEIEEVSNASSLLYCGISHIIMIAVVELQSHYGWKFRSFLHPSLLTSADTELSTKTGAEAIKREKNYFIDFPTIEHERQQ